MLLVAYFPFGTNLARDRVYKLCAVDDLGPPLDLGVDGIPRRVCFAKPVTDWHVW